MSLLICPNCKVGMKAVVRHDVEIDVCPECQGVWLDPGELDKLLVLLQQKRPAAPVSFLPRDAEGMPSMGMPARPVGPGQYAEAQHQGHHGQHGRDDGHDRRYDEHDRRYDEHDRRYDEHDRRYDGHSGDRKKTGWRGLMDIFD